VSAIQDWTTRDVVLADFGLEGRESATVRTDWPSAKDIGRIRADLEKLIHLQTDIQGVVVPTARLPLPWTTI
jgi:hypothetical protein